MTARSRGAASRDRASPEVVIAGGGIVGAALALELARAGVAVAMLGQGMPVYDAAVLAAALHASAGDEALQRFGYGLTASDVIDAVGQHLAELIA